MRLASRSLLIFGVTVAAMTACKNSGNGSAVKEVSNGPANSVAAINPAVAANDIIISINNNCEACQKTAAADPSTAASGEALGLTEKKADIVTSINFTEASDYTALKDWYRKFSRFWTPDAFNAASDSELLEVKNDLAGRIGGLDANTMRLSVTAPGSVVMYIYQGGPSVTFVPRAADR